MRRKTHTCFQLGVTLDNKLKFDSHIASICRKAGGQVNALNRLKNVLPSKTKEALYHAFILPHFDIVARYGTIVEPETPRNWRE